MLHISYLVNTFRRNSGKVITVVAIKLVSRGTCHVQRVLYAGNMPTDWLFYRTSQLSW